MSQSTTFGLGPAEIIIILLAALFLYKASGHKHGRAVLTAFGLALLGGAAVLLLYFVRASHDGPAEVAIVAETATTVPAAQTVEVEASQPGTIPVESELAAEGAALAKPAWVEEESRLVGDDYFITATVGPHATRQLCDQAMTEELRRATEHYIDSLIGYEGAGRLVELPLSTVRQEVVQEEFLEPVQASFGPMLNLHVRLKFDKKMQDRIVRAHEQELVQSRLGVAGGGIALVLVILSTLYGYLRLDTATRGYYSGRLKLAAAAVILTAIAAAGRIFV